MSTHELPLSAPPETLAQLVALLPTGGAPIMMREEGSVACPYVLSIVVGILREALARGSLVDRTNGNGPIEEWDGWLVIHGEKVKTFIRTAWDKDSQTFSQG